MSHPLHARKRGKKLAGGNHYALVHGGDFGHGRRHELARLLAPGVRLHRRCGRPLLGYQPRLPRILAHLQCTMQYFK